ncbi:MAG: type II secretion system protein [Rhodocyclaceae bacterium]|nr:type II secretion system protein [Rhodocyclaceae bacterium]
MRAERGFSLIEVLVAFSIMALALGVLYQSGAGSLRAAVLSEQQTRAALWGQSLLAARDAVPAAGWHDAGLTEDGFGWQIGSRPLQDASAPADAIALHEVVVTVDWTDRGRRREFRIATVLPQVDDDGVR